MTDRTWYALPLATILLTLPVVSSPVSACCPAPPSGEPVVNADQTVILIWDAATKTGTPNRNARRQGTRFRAPGGPSSGWEEGRSMTAPGPFT